MSHLFKRSLASLASPAAPPHNHSARLPQPICACRSLETCPHSHTASTHSKNKHGGVGGGENHQRDGVAASSTRPFRRLLRPHGTSCGSPDVPEAHPEPSRRLRAPLPDPSCPGDQYGQIFIPNDCTFGLFRLLPVRQITLEECDGK